MFVPGVNGSIISNAPSGSRLKSAYKNSKKRKMSNGGTLPPRYTSNPRDPRLLKFNDSMSAYNYGEGKYRSIQKIMDSARSPKNADFRENYNIGPAANPPSLKFDAYRGPNGYLMNPYKNYYESYNQKPLTLTEKIFGNDKQAYNINFKTNELVPGKPRITDSGYGMFVGYSRFKKPVAPIYYGENKKPTASTKSILTKVSKPYVYKKPEVVPEVTETPQTVAPIEQPVKKIGYNKPIIQQFNYMSNENKAKALQKYGSVSDIPYQGVNINELKDGGRLNKYQTGGEDIQKRLNRYMAQDNTKSYALPNGLSFNTGLKGIQNQYLNQNLPTDKLGDLSPQVLEDLRNSAKNLKLDYRSSLNLPRKLGNIGYNSSYGLANPKSTKDLLTDLTYTRSFPGGNIRATTDSQQLNLKSKGSNLNISRNVKDSKVSNQFNFNAQVLPETLSVYGAGQFNPNEVITFKGIDPLKPKVNAKGNVGVRGTTKNLDYDVKGSYDPKTGLNYQGDAAVRMFKDRLNVSGSATTKDQLLDDYNLNAGLKLGKNLNLSAFRKNKEGEKSYGVGVKANLGPVNLDLYQNKADNQNSYGATLKTNVGPVNLSGNANYNSNMMQDYNVAADVDLLRATKQNPNRGTLNLSGNYGASRDEMGTMSPSYGLNLKYTNSFQKGGETDPVMEGERMQELPIHKKLSWSEKLRRNINRFEKKIGLGSAKKVNDVTEGSTSWTPTVPKPYMRTMQEPPGGYRDNMKVVTPDSFIDSANRARIDAQQAEEARRKRSGVISQGTPRSAYEKAREASSFVSQAKRRKGSADPLDYVLDMVNPAAIGFAGVDLIGSTGSAVSNLAQGNLKEAGSDLLNAGLNALDVVPLTRGLGLGTIAKPAIKKVAQPFLKYADDVVQTSKIAGKPTLPTYKNVYRAEHAKFNTMAKSDDLTGRWALDNPKEAEFYVRNLKTPRGDSYTTRNYFKGEVEPVRIMKDRLPEYKMKQQFAEGMPEEARIMSMGRGKLTDKELASVLGDDGADRMRNGILTEMDYNTMSTAPFMYNPTEGILNANRMNQLRKGENTFLGRGKTNLFPDQKKAFDYLDAQNNSRYSASPFTKYLPFSPYKNGGKIEDDKDMVNGVASILRRVESKPNRLKLANQLSKQFNREKVKYDLPSFLNKSKVKK